jgi:double-stranded uracil-DNA glycosylase
MHSQGFAPIARADARVLILGSLPGRESLRRRQYYAQPQNAFWRIMGALFDAGPERSYAERRAQLIAARVAVWDVCAAAYRAGSLDSAILASSVVANDLGRFLARHPAIGLVCFNGAKAAALYRRHVLPALPPPLRELRSVVLPSTSPAHASLRLERKIAAWALLRAHARRSPATGGPTTGGSRRAPAPAGNGSRRRSGSSPRGGRNH